MDYISKEDAIKDICSKCEIDTYETCDTIQRGSNFCREVKTLMEYPAADVVGRNTLQHSQHVESAKNALDVPERNVGKWEQCSDSMMVCSECGKYWILDDERYDFNYCPHCGAKMEG